MRRGRSRRIRGRRRLRRTTSRSRRRRIHRRASFGGYSL